MSVEQDGCEWVNVFLVLALRVVLDKGPLHGCVCARVIYLRYGGTVRSGLVR